MIIHRNAIQNFTHAENTPTESQKVTKGPSSTRTKAIAIAILAILGVAFLTALYGAFGPVTHIPKIEVKRINAEVNQIEQTDLSQIIQTVKRLDDNGDFSPTFNGLIVENFRQLSMRVVDHHGLKLLYGKIGWCGSGGNGVVFRVVNRANSQKRALKIATETHKVFERTTLSITNTLLDSDQIPHLTRVFRANAVMMFYDYPIFSNEENEFLRTPSIEYFRSTSPKKVVAWSAYEMELMEGDLAGLGTKHFDEDAIGIQRAATSLVLNKFGVRTSDEKYRNVMYKTLTGEDTFKGKALIAYDYWNYTFGNFSLYVPRQRFLIKLGDYDRWANSLFREDHSFIGASYSGYNELRAFSETPWKDEMQVVESLAAKYPKPACPNAKILDMTPQSLT